MEKKEGGRKWKGGRCGVEREEGMKWREEERRKVDLRATIYMKSYMGSWWNAWYFSLFNYRDKHVITEICSKWCKKCPGLILCISIHILKLLNNLVNNFRLLKNDDTPWSFNTFYPFCFKMCQKITKNDKKIKKYKFSNIVSYIFEKLFMKRN